jgi:hypothetical protein
VIECRAGGGAEGAGYAGGAARRAGPPRAASAGGDGVHDDGLRAADGQHQHPRRHGPDAGPLLPADALTDRPAGRPAA